MKKILKSRKIIEVFVIFLLSLTPLFWLRGDEIILGHDSGFRLDMISYFKSLFYSWNPMQGFGIDWSLNKGFLMAQLPELLFTELFGSLHWGQIATFVFWFFAMGISMYLLVNNFFPQKKFWVARVFASTFYIYNFFLLQGWFIAERAKFSLFAALPLAFLVLYKTMTKKHSPIKGAILFSFIFFFFNLGGSPPFYGPVLLVCGASFIYLALVEYLKIGVKSFLFSLKTLIIFITTFLLLNSYWIIPQVVTARSDFSSALENAGGVEGILAWEKVINQFTSFTNLFRMQGIPDWYSTKHLYSSNFLENPGLIIVSYFALAVILFGLYKYKSFNQKVRNDKLVYLLILILLLALLFAAGSHPPFGFIYVFLIKYLPGFTIFRTPFFKFSPAYIFPMVFLAGYFLNVLLLKFIKRKSLFNFLGIFVILGVLLYHYPFATVNIFSWNEPFSTKVTVPEYVYEMTDYVNKESKIDSRILVLPPLDQGFHADGYKWGYWSLDLLPRLSFNRSVLGNDSSFPPVISDVYKAIESGNEEVFNLLTRNTGIDMVLWRNDVLYDDKVTTSDDLKGLENNLEGFSSTTLLKEYGDWRLYGIGNDTLPAIYAVGTVVETNSDKGVIDGLLYELADEASQSFGIIRSRDLNSKQSKKIDLLDKRKIIEAWCLYCGPGELSKVINEVSLSYTRFLPGSTFYPLIELKERWLLESVEDDPSGKIGVQLVLASKRLAEIKWLLDVSPNEELQGLLDLSIKKYQEHIDSAIGELPKLSEVDRNFKNINIYSYTSAHQKLWPLFGKLSRANENSFQSLFNYLEEKSSLMEKEMWVTRNPAVLKLSLNIDKGSYKIIIKGSATESVVIGDSLLENGDIVDLENGIQKIKILLKQTENQLEIDTPRNVFQPVYGEAYTIENFDFKEDYVISFKYKKKQEVPVKVIVSYDGDRALLDGSNLNLVKDLSYSNRWEEFSFKFTPIVGARDASIGFLYKAFNDKEALLIDDLKVKKHMLTRIFLEKEEEHGKVSLPEVVYTRVNTGLYKVKITNVISPFLLVFGESFSKGWVLLKEGREFGEVTHLLVNGYANGWLIESIEDQELELVFTPQKDFATGLVISSVSLVGFLLLLIWPRRVKYKKDENN